MPKKFTTENTKAVAAKARKSTAKTEEALKKEKEKEEEYWRDDDKHINRKKERKENQEKKKIEQSQRKAELKSLAEQEEVALKQTAKQPLAKLSRAQIQEETDRRNAAIAAALAADKKKESATHLQKPLEENINRVVDDAVEARGINEALAVLTVKSNLDEKHPERRMKAAFAAFELANMSRIKEENPTLRLSQLKQVLHKEWLKSPDNPINQMLNKRDD